MSFSFRSLRPAALALVTALTVALGACSNQGEGELCDHRLGDSDCNSGLTCVMSGAITQPASCPTCYGVCCPASGQSSVSACSPSAFIDASPNPTLSDATVDGSGEDGGGNEAASGDDGGGGAADALSE